MLKLHNLNTLSLSFFFPAFSLHLSFCLYYTLFFSLSFFFYIYTILSLSFHMKDQDGKGKIKIPFFYFYRIIYNKKKKLLIFPVCC